MSIPSSFFTDDDYASSSSSTKTNFFLQKKENNNINDMEVSQHTIEINSNQYTDDDEDDDDECLTKNEYEKIQILKEKISKRKKIRIFLKILALTLVIIIASIIALSRLSKDTKISSSQSTTMGKNNTNFLKAYFDRQQKEK